MPSSARYGGRPFGEQVAFFRQKVNIPTRAWTDLLEGEHDAGFMVAGASKASLVQDFRQAVDRFQAEGRTLEDFRKDFDEIVKRHGWAYQGGRNWRTRVIYETNLRQSYHAGREAQMADPELQRRRPYGLYRHGGSDEPRDEHKEKDGMVVRLDDPWWDVWSPQNGWGCSCKKFMISKREVENLGLTITERPPVGEMREVTVGARGPSPRKVKVPQGIDPGFAYRPGASAMELVSRVGAGMTPDLSSAYAQAVAPIMGRVLQREYAPWIDGVLRAGQSRGQVATIGMLLPVELAGLRARGIEPIRTDVSLEDRLIVGRKAVRHEASRRGLTDDEWRRLPELAAGRTAAVFDTQKNNLLLVITALDGRNAKIALEPNFVRGGQSLNSARTVFKMDIDALRDRQRYDLLWGEL